MGPLKSEGSETHTKLPDPGGPTPGRGNLYHLILKSSEVYILEGLKVVGNQDSSLKGPPYKFIHSKSQLRA